MVHLHWCSFICTQSHKNLAVYQIPRLTFSTHTACVQRLWIHLKFLLLLSLSLYIQMFDVFYVSVCAIQCWDMEPECFPYTFTWALGHVNITNHSCSKTHSESRASLKSVGRLRKIEATRCNMLQAVARGAAIGVANLR